MKSPKYLTDSAFLMNFILKGFGARVMPTFLRSSFSAPL